MQRKRISLLLLGMLSLPGAYAAKPTESMMPPIIIDAEPAQQTQWQSVVRSIGTVSAFEGTAITAEIAGRITKLYTQSEHTVKKGDLIVEIFPDVLKAQLKQEQAQLLLDTKTYQREAKLAKKGFITQQMFDQAKSTVTQDQAKIEQTQAQLTQTIIVAPFDGRLGSSQVSLGQYVTPGTVIGELQQLDKLYVDFALPSQYVPMIHLGDAVQFTNRAYPKTIFTGTIISTGSTIDPETRMITIRSSIDNSKALLLPGAFMETKLYICKKHAVITIPETALVYSEEGPFVYLLSPKNTAVKTKVTLGDRLSDNRVIITSGIKVGDQVITAGQMKIDQDNAPVMTEAAANAYFSHANAQQGDSKK